MKITPLAILTLFLSLLVFSSITKADYREDLSNLSPEDNAWVQDACKSYKSSGPSSYIFCIRREISALQEDAKSQSKKLPPTSISTSNQVKSDANNNQDKDLNVDYAVITTPKANLRDAASINGLVLSSLKQGDMVVLLETSASDGWYNVIDVATGLEGWLNEATIKINLTNNPKKTQLFEAETLPYFSEPEIVVENASTININLKIGTQLIIIPAKSNKSLKISQGSYKYYASAPGVFPSLGTQIFDNSHRYSWKFWIETSYGGRGRKQRR